VFTKRVENALLSVKPVYASPAYRIRQRCGVSEGSIDDAFAAGSVENVCVLAALLAHRGSVLSISALSQKNRWKRTNQDLEVHAK